jgi:hypothetical protein
MSAYPSRNKSFEDNAHSQTSESKEVLVVDTGDHSSGVEGLSWHSSEVHVDEVSRSQHRGSGKSEAGFRGVSA